MPRNFRPILYTGPIIPDSLVAPDRGGIAAEDLAPREVRGVLSVRAESATVGQLPVIKFLPAQGSGIDVPQPATARRPYVRVDQINVAVEEAGNSNTAIPGFPLQTIVLKLHVGTESAYINTGGALPIPVGGLGGIFGQGAPLSTAVTGHSLVMDAGNGNAWYPNVLGPKLVDSMPWFFDPRKVTSIDLQMNARYNGTGDTPRFWAAFHFREFEIEEE